MEVTAELTRRIEDAVDRAALTRIGGVAQLDGNPLGVETRQFGPLTATVVRRPQLYYGYYNVVRGLSANNATELPNAVAWLRGEGTSPRITLAPLHTERELETTLMQLGLRQTATMSVLTAHPQQDPKERDIEVAELPVGIRDAFEELWLHDVPAPEQEGAQKLCAAEFSRWRVYVGFDAGRPAAYGCLYVDGGAGILASAWTAPASRGKGLQSALIRRRIADAVAAGCDLVISTAVPDSQSERNLLRLGFVRAYTQSIWTA